MPACYLAPVSKLSIVIIASSVLVAGVYSTTRAAAPNDTKKTKQAKKSKRSLNKLRREAPRMDNTLLDAEIKQMSKSVTGGIGNWTFELDSASLTVITDSRADRMRIISPIIEVEKLDRKDLMTLLEANFDRALDAKYTVSNDLVWAAYVHPLSPLTKSEFKSAALQVAALRNNYGTSYSSTDVVFGAAAP